MFFLFEKRKSTKHKWVPAHGCNNKIPRQLSDASNVYFVPHRWRKSRHDAQGAQFLASIVALDDGNRYELFEPALDTILDEYSAANSHVVQPLVSTKLLKRNQKHLCKQVQQLLSCGDSALDLSSSIRYHSTLTVQQLVCFFDDLQNSAAQTSLDRVAPTSHTILRLIFQHMRLKLCTLEYSQVRVHFIVVTVPVSSSSSSSSSSGSSSSGNTNCSSSNNSDSDGSDGNDGSNGRNGSNIDTKDVGDRECSNEGDASDADCSVCSSNSAQSCALYKAKVARVPETDLSTECTLSDDDEIDGINDDEIDGIDDEIDGNDDVDEIDGNDGGSKKDYKRAPLRRALSSSLSWTSSDSGGPSAAIVETADDTRATVEQTSLLPPPPPLPPVVCAETEGSKRLELCLADVYNNFDESAENADDGWDLDCDFDAPTTTVKDDNNDDSGILSPALPPTKAAAEDDDDTFSSTTESDGGDNAREQQQQVTCETFPKELSILTDSTILAISKSKQEARDCTNWLFRHFCGSHPHKKFRICYISQNFSAQECERIERYVASKRDRGEAMVIGVECEFAPVDAASSQCTTLLNEFDGRTSHLILKILCQPHTAVVFETTKSFNHVWCWKYNIVNSPASCTFLRANKDAASSDDLATQRGYQAAAIVELVKQASTQAAALVRCAGHNLDEMSRETFFDAVVLGYNADFNEKQKVFNFLNDQRLQQKLEHERWQTRVCRLQCGDSFYIPLSKRQNNHSLDLNERLNRQSARMPPATNFAYSGAKRNHLGLFGAAQLSIPTPSSYLFTSNLTNYRYGDPAVLKKTSRDECDKKKST